MPARDVADAQLVAELEMLRQRIEQLEIWQRQLTSMPSSSSPSQPLTGRAAPDQPSIFVSIASYCDPALPRTLNDCIANAQYPQRLRFGVCWQYDSQRPVDVTPFQRDKRFRFVTYPIEESQGGTWARSIAQQFWDGEAYTLQIDSHSKFEPGWDSTLIGMLRSMPSDKPLLTINSPLFWYDEQGHLHRQTDKGIRGTKVTSWHSGDGWAPWFDWGIPIDQRPAHNRFISGNFVFTLGQWNVEVPQDPEHYYWGEEFNLTVRTYTHGYDLFLPTEIAVWHMLHQEAPPRRHWEHGEAVVQGKNRVAYQRLHWLLYSDDDGDQEKLGPFGLGRQRSKRDYERYAGMDFKSKRAHPDVYTGACPDPVTIRSEDDWQHCLTFAEYERFRKLSAASST